MANNDELSFEQKGDLELFRSYYNDFLTVERFAEYYGLSLEQAHNAISRGRDQHNAIAAHKQANS